MADKSDKNQQGPRLVDIVRESRIAAATREDVVVDMKEADKARLELLAEKLKPIVDDIDEADDRFDFVISSGVQPRLWIDPVAHIHMGRDRRTYRFVRDSRLGRIVIFEGGDIEQAHKHVANYIADRIVEREKLIEGDLESFKDYYARMTNENLGTEKAEPETFKPDEFVAEKRSPSESASFVIGITWFILGSVLGLALAFNYHAEIFEFLQNLK